jgi:hypothetical protein
MDDFDYQCLRALFIQTIQQSATIHEGFMKESNRS